MNIIKTIIKFGCNLVVALACLMVNAEILKSYVLGMTDVWTLLIMLPFLVMMVVAVEIVFNIVVDIFRSTPR